MDACHLRLFHFLVKTDWHSLYLFDHWIHCCFQHDIIFKDVVSASWLWTLATCGCSISLSNGHYFLVFPLFIISMNQFIKKKSIKKTIKIISKKKKEKKIMSKKKSFVFYKFTTELKKTEFSNLLVPKKIMSQSIAMSYFLWNILLPLHSFSSFSNLNRPCMQGNFHGSRVSNEHVREIAEVILFFVHFVSWCWIPNEKPDGENLDCETAWWNFEGRVLY